MFSWIGVGGRKSAPPAATDISSSESSATNSPIAMDASPSYRQAIATGRLSNSVTTLQQTRPIPFIQVDEKEKFYVHKDAKKLLSSIKGPICPIIVAGPYRTGKSTLLNLLIHMFKNANSTNSSSASVAASLGNRRNHLEIEAGDKNNTSGGFAVGGTVQACTKGIWLWGEPIYDATTKKTILLLDSEGLGNTEQFATFDAQIFSLSLLLSSMFIFNTTGAITEPHLEQLQLVVEMTQRIRISDSQQKSSTFRELGTLFPQFLWILRDFSLALENKHGNAVTSSEYLENQLQPLAKHTKGAAEKNSIRQAITECFPHRDCVTLVRPVLDERALQKLYDLPISSYRPEFFAQLQDLHAKISREVSTKRLENTELSGQPFVLLAESYVKSINVGAVPVIHNAWQNVVELTNRDVLQKVLDRYEHNIKDRIVLKNELFLGKDLEALFHACYDEAIRTLEIEGMGSKEMLPAMIQRFETKIEGWNETYRHIHDQHSKEHCQELLESLWKNSKILENVQNNVYQSPGDLQQDIGQLMLAYATDAKGTAAESIFRFAAYGYYGKIHELLFQKVANASKRYEDEVRRSENLQRETEDLRGRLQFAERERETAMNQLRNENERIRLHAKEENDDLLDRLRKTEKSLFDTKDEQRATRSQNEKTIEQLQRDNASLRSQLNESENRALHSSAEVRKLESEKVALAEQYNHSEGYTRSKENELSRRHQENVALQNEVDNLRQHVKDLEDQNFQHRFQQQQQPQQQQRQQRFGGLSSIQEDESMPSDEMVHPEDDDGSPAPRSNPKPRYSSVGRIEGQGRNGSADLENPNSLTITELKSWLVQLNVDVPMDKRKKEFYVDLLYETLPELSDLYPNKTAGKKRKTKG